jgi:hypothetical protein
MNPIFTVVALLAVIAWSDGGLVVDIPGLNTPSVNRGVK